MKTRLLRSLVLLVGLNVLQAFPLAQSWAQPETSTPEQVAIKLQHVRPEMMAQWLSPQEPGPQGPVKLDGNSILGRAVDTEIPPLFDIPGLQEVIANAGTNEVLAKGTPESIEKLREFISLLDSPVRQAEVKIQFIEVTPEIWNLDSNTFRNAKTNLPDVKTNFIAEKSRFEDELKALIKLRQARILHTSQLTIPNNSTANVRLSANGFSPRLEAELTPTIQNDDTIYLLVKCLTGGKQAAPSPRMFSITAAIFKEGDCLVSPLAIPGGQPPVILLIASARILED